MFDFYEKRRLRGIVFSRVTAGAVFIIAALLFVSAYDRYTAERDTREKRLTRAEELTTIRQRAAALEAKVRMIESERGMEDAIRERFDVSRPGEEVVVVVDERAGKDDARPEVFPLPPKPSLLEWLKFW